MPRLQPGCEDRVARKRAEERVRCGMTVAVRKGLRGKGEAHSMPTEVRADMNDKVLRVI